MCLFKVIAREGTTVVCLFVCFSVLWHLGVFSWRLTFIFRSRVLENKSPSVSSLVSHRLKQSESTNVSDIKTQEQKVPKKPKGEAKQFAKVLMSSLAYPNTQILDSRKYIKPETQCALLMTVHVKRKCHKCMHDHKQRKSGGGTALCKYVGGNFLCLVFAYFRSFTKTKQKLWCS